MSSRRFNQYVDVLTNSPGKDAIGGAVNTWTVSGQVWASIENQASTRTRLDGGFRTNETTTIYISQRPVITALDRLRYNGQVYRIESLYYDEDNDQLVCNCTRYTMDDTEAVQ